MSNDFKPSADIATLRARSELMQRVRKFFLDRDFFEVDTPLLSRDTVVDRFVDPLVVSVPIPGENREYFLQTSPEFAMKRLLTSGADAIFNLGKAFRAGELGAQHNPEFSMLEWYRVGDDYVAGRKLLDEFAQSMLNIGPAKPMTYRNAFVEFIGIDPFLATDRELIEAAQQAAKTDSKIDDRDECLNLLMSTTIESRLAEFESVIIYDWPESQAALAKTRSENDSIKVAERFELYARGVELANGYHELTDPEELRRRNDRVNRQREADGTRALPANSRLLSAMKKGLPNCTGTALGFDRLAMLALKKDSIADVVPFVFDKA